MSAWLYQMTSNKEEPWNPNQYRMEVWEGSPVTWPVGRILKRGGEGISRGDTVVFFFAKTGNSEPGLYGWGIVLEIVESNVRNRIKFQVSPPSDYLKMIVIWDKQLEEVIERIRGDVAQGTMWPIDDKDFEIIKNKIAAA
jgi:hypothetical protein